MLLLVGLVVAAVVLWPSGEPERKPSRVRLVSVPPLGLAFAHPTSWKRTVRKQVITLRSPEGSMLLAFSSPVARPATAFVKDGARRALSRRFEPVRIVRDGPGLLGNRRASTFELRGHDESGPVRALVLVEDTPHRTYAVTLLSGAKPSRRRLREAGGILQTVRLSKPVRSRR